jgi:ABC-type branched-subunit amino acid transport system ATPase component
VDDVLEVTRLSIRFGETRVVTDLRFRVARGTSLAIIGPNGSGKTVLFRALIGSIPFEGDERTKAKIACPGCGSEDVEALMQAFVAKTAKKS